MDHLKVGRRVMFILDFAHYLFQQILQCNYALEAAVLVDDDSEMRLRRLHLPQGFIERRGVRYEKRLASNGQQFELTIPSVRGDGIAHKIFAMRHADHIVQLSAVDGHSRVSAVDELARGLVITQRRFERGNLRPRHHDFTHDLVREIENVMDHSPLVLVKHAALKAYRHYVAKLLFAVHHRMRGRNLKPKDPQEITAGVVQQIDKRAEHFVKQLDGAGNRQGDRLRFFKGDRFRSYLAQDHGEERHQRESYFALDRWARYDPRHRSMHNPRE